MSLIDFSIRRPVTVFIGAVAAVVFGVVAYSQLATELLPDITYPSLTVKTTYEGTAPVEVESLITRPVENAVGVVNNVVRVTSSSRADTSEVTLEFAWSTNMDMAALDIRERLDMLQLPPDAERPVLLRYDPSLDPILRLGVTGGGDLLSLRLLADEEVRRALERIEGVAAAVVSGGLEEEVQVDLDEGKLAGLGLTVDRVVQRLGQENINLTGGRLREGQTEFLVRTVNQVVRPEDLQDIVIDASGGATIRLRDVAHVYRGHKERDVITRIDGKEAVEVAIYKEGGTNTVTVSDAVQQSLAGLQARLSQIDPSLRLTVITDQARYIRQSIREVLSTALYGGVLAILVLFLFLRAWKSTFIIGIAIPLSIAATFFLMYVFGISLNVMSLGGLTLGIGMLVDNAIVVLEAIQRKRDDGLPPVEAAREGAGEVSRAVVASTLTTICVFVPIVFVEGVAGQLFGDLALTVTFSLSSSLLVALTLIPMLAARNVRRDELAAEGTADGAGRTSPLARAGFRAAVSAARVFGAVFRGLGALVAALTAWPLRIFHAIFDRLTAFYARHLAWVLSHPVRVVAVTFLAFVASLFIIPELGRQLVPELIQGELFVNLELPPGTRLEVTERRLAGIEKVARAIPGIRTVYALSGASNEQGGTAGEKRENIGQITVVLTPPTSKAREEAVMDTLRGYLDRFDDLNYLFGRPAYFSFRTPIEVEIRGYNLNLLATLAKDLVTRMKAIPGLADVKSSTEGGNPELQIRFDRVRLAAMGLSIQDVASLLRTKVQGTIATDIQRQDRQVDIRVRDAESFRDSVQDLSQLSVMQDGRTAIPLSAVADVEEVQGPAEIRRAEGERVALVTANLTNRDLGSVSEDISSALRSMSMPSGYDWTLGGQRQEMEKSFSSMRLAIALAVFMVYLVMASQFESLVHPFVILFSVPFAAIGVLVTLFVTSTPISVVVLIGVILMAGIVVNNAIILIDYTNTLRDRGMEKIEALKRAGVVRLRPILMTTSTTVLGLLPMALGLGEGSELRRPMAITVIGGLMTSTLLTLSIIPAVYHLLDRKRRKGIAS
ncbi:MAG TPA: efflux RND transporter permease subunit [Candidatus Saccharimonadales bacterium]|nr:efflux RND transporter permease subunit [Candidatus Saccharimonadales bacterium]